MKNQISFMSSLFDGKAAFPAVGDVQTGKDLALWMEEKSKGSEFLFGPPVENSGGWSETVTAEDESFVVGFVMADAAAGSDYVEWTITIDKHRRWKFLGSKDSPSRSRLCDLIHNILRDERGIREVQWG